MMWHIYRSIAVGHARVANPKANPAHLASDVLRIEAAHRGESELLGAFIAISHQGGTARFKIIKTAEGALGLEGAR